MKLSDKHLVIVSSKHHLAEKDAPELVYTTGGFPALTNEISKYFKSVCLAVPVEEISFLEETISYRENIALYPIPLITNNKGSYILAQAKALRPVIDEADLVYAMGPYDTGLLGLLLARLKRKPVFTSIDTDRAFVHFCELTAIDTKTIKGVKDRLRKYLSYFAVKYIIYNILRILNWNKYSFITGNMFLGKRPKWHQWIKSTFTSQEIPDLVIQKESSDRFNIVFIGRLSYVKNIPTLIKAFANLPPTRYTLTIIGSGPLRRELEKLVEKDVAEPQQVCFTGHLSKEELLATRLKGADVLVLPSFEERQGKVLLEAMACSVPVIASKVGGIPSVINQEENGLLFNAESVKDLSQCIVRIREDDDLREKLVRNGHTYAKRYALDSEIGRLMNLLEGGL